MDFVKKKVEGLIQSYSSNVKLPLLQNTLKSSISNVRISDELRYDQMNHLVIEVPNKKRRRCAADKCKSHIQTMCIKCNLGLCIPCFRLFHEK